MYYEHTRPTTTELSNFLHKIYILITYVYSIMNDRAIIDDIYMMSMMISEIWCWSRWESYLCTQYMFIFLYLSQSYIIMQYIYIYVYIHTHIYIYTHCGWSIQGSACLVIGNFYTCRTAIQGPGVPSLGSGGLFLSLNPPPFFYGGDLSARGLRKAGIRLSFVRWQKFQSSSPKSSSDWKK